LPPQRLANARCALNARQIDDATWQFTKDRLREQCSPDQISNHAAISHETVYQRVYADKRAGGTLWCNLRCQKLRRKRYGKNEAVEKPDFCIKSCCNLLIYKCANFAF